MSQAWTFNQISKLRRYRPEMVDEALSEMLSRESELRWLVVVGAYMDGGINLGKAAELIGIHRLELQETFMNQGIPLRVGSQTAEEAKAEVEAILQWNASSEDEPGP